MVNTRAYATSLSRILSDELRTTFYKGDSEEGDENAYEQNSSEHTEEGDDDGNGTDDGGAEGNRVFIKAFCWHANRIFDHAEDLGSILVLELYNDGLIGQSIEHKQLHRILTRIRKRIVRQLRDTQLPSAESAVTENDQHSSEFADALLELDARETLIAEELLRRRAIDDVREMLDLSRSEYYRQRSKVKEKLQTLLDVRFESN